MSLLKVRGQVESSAKFRAVRPKDPDSELRPEATETEGAY